MGSFSNPTFFGGGGRGGWVLSMAFLLFFVPLLLGVSWSSCSLSDFVDMADFTCYCWSCFGNSVCRLMFDINLHPLLAAYEVSGDVMVGGQCHRCSC